MRREFLRPIQLLHYLYQQILFMKKTFLLLLSLSAVMTTWAQGVKIGSNSGEPDESAILDLESDTRGLLPPRMTTIQRDAITNPALGLQIFNTTTNCLNLFIGTTWKQVCGDCDFNSPIA